MEERNLTEKESLEVITSMISRTKQRYMLGDGNIMLMWGYLTVLVTALVWLLVALTQNPVWNWLWFLIWVVGGTATPVMARKEKINRGVKSYSDKLCSQIWSAVGFFAVASVLCCLVFLSIGIDCWIMMFVLALVIVPFAEIAQGLIIRERSLVAGGAVGLLIGIITVCCIAGRVALYAEWYLPLFMLAFVSMMVVPGHVLNYKARRQQ